MNLRSTGFFSIALAGALAAGACSNMNGDGNLTGALDNTKAASLPAEKAPGTLPSKTGPRHPNSTPLDKTKAASLPAKKAPGTLPSRTGPVHPNTPPLAETKAARMVYGAAPSTRPDGRRLTGQQIRTTFRGRRTRFMAPNGTRDVTFRSRTIVYTRPAGRAMTGNWWVRGNRMCVRWPNLNASCYDVYAAGPNQYSVWLKNRPRGRISVH